MAGSLAGAVQAPITSFVIVLEMTEDHAMIISTTVTAPIAHAASALSFLEKLPGAYPARTDQRALRLSPDERQHVPRFHSP
ncbi:chloride channel protein [Beijerinckia indica]|uniref:chloride channel protein n=1 Tax=Beijerinckia indica TaxID=533 RepID=UPI0002F859FD